MLGRSVGGQVRPGAAQQAVDRRRGRVQHLGDLGRAERQHVAQRQHGPLPGGQELECGDEGEPHAGPARDHVGRIVGRSASGAGCSHGTDGSAAATSTRWSSEGPPSPDGSGRRARVSSAVRHARVAIAYSHRRTEERPSNRSMARQARR